MENHGERMLKRCQNGSQHIVKNDKLNEKGMQKIMPKLGAQKGVQKY